MRVLFVAELLFGCRSATEGSYCGCKAGIEVRSRRSVCTSREWQKERRRGQAGVAIRVIMMKKEAEGSRHRQKMTMHTYTYTHTHIHTHRHTDTVASTATTLCSKRRNGVRVHCPCAVKSISVAEKTPWSSLASCVRLGCALGSLKLL